MEGEQPYLGDLLTMVTNHLLTGMILQAPTPHDPNIATEIWGSVVVLLRAWKLRGTKKHPKIWGWMSKDRFVSSEKKKRQKKLSNSSPPPPKFEQQQKKTEKWWDW